MSDKTPPLMLEAPPSGWITQSDARTRYYPSRARSGDALCAIVAASGHSEADARTILTNLDRLGWRLVKETE